MSLNESIVEDAALTWFAELGYAVGHGPQLAPGEPAAERDSFGEVVLVGRLREAIRRLNPAIPEEAREEALRKVLRVATTSLVQTNRAFHRMLRDGVDVEYARADGSIKGDKARHPVKGTVRLHKRAVRHAQHLAQRLLPCLLWNRIVQPPQRLAQTPHQHHLAKRIPFRRCFAGRDMRPVPDRIAQLPEPCQGGVFDVRFVEAHWFTRRRGDAEGWRLLTMRCSPSLSVAAPKLMSSPTGRFIRRR